MSAEGAGVVTRVDRDLPVCRHVTERALGVQKESQRAVVGREQIEGPITVDVSGTRTDRTVGRILGRAASPRDARELGNVREAARVVLKQSVRVTVHVADIEIEVAVLVVIEPDGADASPRIRQADLRRNIGKPSGVVAVQRVRTIPKRYEQIQIPIAIDVDPGRLTHGARGYRELRR